MTDPEDAEDTDDTEDTAANKVDLELRAERRRRRLAALGDTASERSADDSDDGWSERDAPGSTCA